MILLNSKNLSMITGNELLTKMFTFNLTPNTNGGESIVYSCNYKDGNSFTQITLNSYSSDSTITTYETITSETLFKLAKELQKFELQQELTH